MTVISRIRAATAGSDGERGFTLIEVIVACVLLALVMASTATFFIRGVGTATTNERRLSAVEVGGQAMEYIRSISPLRTGSETSVDSLLLKGRARDDVLARWTGSGTYPTPPAELAGTSPAWHSATTTGTIPLVPYEKYVTVGNETYKVESFIGTCFRPAGASKSCTSSGSGAFLYRAIVRVTWDEGAGRSCSGKQCSYQVATLIDPNADPEFNTNYVPGSAPVAVNDDVSTTAGQPVFADIVANDTGKLVNSPVVITLTPKYGTLTDAPTGKITYTPNPGFVGTDTFEYTVTDVNGRKSNVGKVTVTVTKPAAPVAKADSYSVEAGAEIRMAVKTNDWLPSPVTVTSTAPSAGSVTVQNGELVYAAPTTPQTVTLTYKVTDAYGQFSQATVTITVTAAKPVARADSFCFANVNNQTVVVDLPVLSNDTYSQVRSLEITSAPDAGQASFESNNKMRFTQNQNGTWPTYFDYRFQQSDGVWSNAATVSVRWEMGSKACA